MLILSFSNYKTPDIKKSKQNTCWRDFAKELGVPTSELVKFLDHVNVVKRVPLPNGNVTRIESTLVVCLRGLTETFFVRKNGSKGGGMIHCSQTKLTPKGKKELKRLYRKEFNQLKKGIPVKDVIENSTSMIFPAR